MLSVNRLRRSRYTTSAASTRSSASTTEHSTAEVGRVSEPIDLQCPIPERYSVVRTQAFRMRACLFNRRIHAYRDAFKSSKVHQTEDLRESAARFRAPRGTH
jgi:hypothetical protein